MKTKAKVPERKEAAQPAKPEAVAAVEEHNQTSNPPRVVESVLPDDGEEFFELKEIEKFLGIGEAPDASDCFETNRRAYLSADAIAQFIELGMREMNQHSTFPEGDSPITWATRALQFQLEVCRLTFHRLYALVKEN
jgi:hypothetical protein